jgi:hypothetical protein
METGGMGTFGALGSWIWSSIAAADFQSGLIGIAMSVVCLAMYRFGQDLPGGARQRARIRRWGEIGAIAGVIGWVIILARTGRLLYDESDTIFGITGQGWFFLPATLISVVVYWCRGFIPKLCGLAEISIGVVAISYATHTPDPTARMLSLASGMYVIVRGFDNVRQGLAPEPRARWLQWFPDRRGK